MANSFEPDKMASYSASGLVPSSLTIVISRLKVKDVFSMLMAVLSPLVAF